MRHGEADHNVAVEAGQGPALRYTEDGTLDSPLTSRGRDQVQLVGKRLEGERFDLAVSSDLVRAVDTGLAITGKSSLFGQMPSDPHCLSHLCRCQVIIPVSGWPSGGPSERGGWGYSRQGRIFCNEIDNDRKNDIFFSNLRNIYPWFEGQEAAQLGFKPLKGLMDVSSVEHSDNNLHIHHYNHHHHHHDH